jgi:hypothetical protein
MKCVEFVYRVTDLMEGELSPWLSVAARLHQWRCDNCRRYLRQMEGTRGAVHALATVAPPAVVPPGLLAQFRARHPPVRAAPAPSPSPILLPLVTLGATLLSALPGHHLMTAEAIAAASAVGLLAVALAALASRHAWVAAALAFAIPSGAALLLAHGGPLGIGQGVRCVLHELATAALPLGGLWLAKNSTRPGRVTVMAVAAVGALAGDAALHLSCPDAGSLSHVLVFHVGGIVAAALLGIALSPLFRAHASPA